MAASGLSAKRPPPSPLSQPSSKHSRTAVSDANGKRGHPHGASDPPPSSKRLRGPAAAFSSSLSERLPADLLTVDPHLLPRVEDLVERFSRLPGDEETHAEGRFCILHSGHLTRVLRSRQNPGESFCSYLGVVFWRPAQLQLSLATLPLPLWPTELLASDIAHVFHDHDISAADVSVLCTLSPARLFCRYHYSRDRTLSPVSSLHSLVKKM